MPAYDYDCAACGSRFEVIHGVHAERPTTCPLCGGGPIRKAISAPAIHYKGSGWAKKERSATATPKTSEPKTADPTSSEPTKAASSDRPADSHSDGTTTEGGPAKTPASTSTAAGPAATSD